MLPPATSENAEVCKQAGPRKLDDKQIRRMLQKRNYTEFIFHNSGILDERERANKNVS